MMYIIGYASFSVGIIGLLLTLKAGKLDATLPNGQIPNIYTISQNPACLSLFMICFGMFLTYQNSLSIILLLLWFMYFTYLNNGTTININNNTNHITLFYYNKIPKFMSFYHLRKILFSLFEAFFISLCIIIGSILYYLSIPQLFIKFFKSKEFNDVRKCKPPLDLSLSNLIFAIKKRFARSLHILSVDVNDEIPSSINVHYIDCSNNNNSDKVCTSDFKCILNGNNNENSNKYIILNFGSIT